MNHSPLANVDTVETGTRIQRRNRSFLTSDRAAAASQPTTSVCDADSGGSSRASVARHRDR
jgi:hypothetical protein